RPAGTTSTSRPSSRRREGSSRRIVCLPAYRSLGRSCGLCFAEALGHRLQEGPGDAGVGLDERAEVPERQPVAVEVALGAHRRRAGAHVDQRDVAEVVARAEAPALVAADRHDGFAALDHEEPRAALALAGDGLARVERPLLEGAAEAFELARLELREEREPLQQLGGPPGRAGAG